MRAEGWSPNGKSRAVLAALISAFLASCTATDGPGLEMAAPAHDGSGVVAMMADVAESSGPETPAAAADSTPEAAGAQLGGKSITEADRKPAATTGDAAQADDAPTGAKQEAPADAAAAAEGPAEAETQQIAAAETPKKKGFLSYFFSPQPAKAEAPSPIVAQSEAPSADEEPAEAKETPAAAEAAAEPARPLIDTKEKADPLVKLASLDPEAAKERKTNALVPMDALPGVRTDSLFEIKRKDGLDDDSDIDLNEAEGGIYHVASAAGLARLAPNGLIKARDSVDTACLKPSLVRMLKQVERRFGKKLIITSGYRSPAYNRKVSGARNSQHMHCAAADILMPGVSKWDIAQYVRAMPGRGGVGTYCHTDAVHIDVGPERDWNWRCRRRK